MDVRIPIFSAILCLFFICLFVCFSVREQSLQQPLQDEEAAPITSVKKRMN